MWPVVGAIAGGLLAAHGARRSAARQADAARDVAEANTELQREFAQHGIQWKVEDAQAAGVHPLFALGASGAAYSPNPIPILNDPTGEALREMGQGVSRAAAASMSSAQRQQHVAQLAQIAASTDRDQAQAAYYRALAAKADQEMKQTRAIPVSPDIKSWELSPKHLDRIEPKADEQISTRSGDPSVTAGLHAGMREYTLFPSGTRFRLPYSEEGPSEAMENIPWWMWPGLLMQNARHYAGSDWDKWIRRFAGEMFGQAPAFRSHDPRLGSSSMGISRQNREIRRAAPRFSQW